MELLNTHPMTKEDGRRIYSRIREEIKTKTGMNIKQFSEATGYDYSYFYPQTLEILPNIHKVIMFADYLEVSTDYLLGREKKKRKVKGE